MNGHGFGTFMLGLTAGAAAGAALGMTMAPSHRQLKRAARMAAPGSRRGIQKCEGDFGNVDQL